mgnify:CR=1 FL=1
MEKENTKTETTENKRPKIEDFHDLFVCKNTLLIFRLLRTRFHLDEKNPSRKNDCVKRFHKEFTSIVSDDLMKTLSKEEVVFFQKLSTFL